MPNCMMDCWKFEDSRLPTEQERKLLSRLMYLAFCDIRALAKKGGNEQARALAEAFHNVPLFMYTEDFSFHAFRESVQRYQEVYHDKLRINYLREWDALRGTVLGNA